MMSTAGAAEKLGRPLNVAHLFADDHDYIALFLDQLGVDPNEKR